jgi:hypothetical protein
MRTISYTIGALFIICFPASGISGTNHVASEGQPVTETQADRLGWPTGVIDLLNDPLRADGWNPWFSEWPNDVNVYEFKPQSSEESSSIIESLTKIRSDAIQIQLNPGNEPHAIGFTTVLPEENDIAAVFSIGSQNLIDPWFQRLPEPEPGIRTFGVHRFTECPKAMPPTLTLYVGHPAIDLNKLDIPANVKVIAEMSDSYREGHKDDATIQDIEQFVTQHAKQRELAQVHENNIE